jgi:hypothetical protein
VIAKVDMRGRLAVEDSAAQATAVAAN